MFRLVSISSNLEHRIAELPPLVLAENLMKAITIAEMDSSDPRRTPLKANIRVMLVCLMFSFCNAQYGYDAGVISGFQSMRGFLRVFGYQDASLKGGWGIDPTSQQLITSFLNVGTMVGVLFTAPFARFFGRRHGVWVS